MANKINVKQILMLHDQGTSNNRISSEYRMSRHSVGEVVSMAKEKGIHYRDIQNLSEAAVYKLFYPDKYASEGIFLDPDYKYVHNELVKTGVTLKLLHSEYCARASEQGAVPMGYSSFCSGYSEFTNTEGVTNHIEHKPGKSVEVDWSGPTMTFYNGYTKEGKDGEEVRVYLFVGCLPFSRFAYVEATLDMKMESFIMAHVHMFEYFGGVPVMIVCDNLKTGVVKHPKQGEIILTGEYQSLGYHYTTAIMPARVRKPKDKPSVENTVGNIATAIIAKLRNKKAHSFLELQLNIRGALEEYNSAPFEKRDGSRREAFKKGEKAFLQPLPAVRYELSEIIRNRKVQLNYHVAYKKNFYSAPYTLIRKSVDLKVTESTVEIYDSDGQRVATHKRIPDYLTNQYSTQPEHMPPSFRHYNEWSDERMKQWAASIGPNTAKAVDRLFEACTIREQAYNSVLALLGLTKKFDNKRLETACRIAFDRGVHTPRYRYLYSVLSSGQDLSYMEAGKTAASKKSEHTKGFLRGSDYYKSSAAAAKDGNQNTPSSSEPAAGSNGAADAGKTESEMRQEETDAR